MSGLAMTVQTIARGLASAGAAARDGFAAGGESGDAFADLLKENGASQARPHPSGAAQASDGRQVSGASTEWAARLSSLSDLAAGSLATDAADDSGNAALAKRDKEKKFGTSASGDGAPASLAQAPPQDVTFVGAPALADAQARLTAASLPAVAPCAADGARTEQAGTGRTGPLPASGGARTRPQPAGGADLTHGGVSLAEPSAAAPPRVAVASQKTWLPPLRPEKAGAREQAPDDGAAREGLSSPAPVTQTGPAGAQAPPVQAPADLASPAEGRGPAGAAVAGGAGEAHARFSSPAPDASAATVASAPRRDLDVTLSPGDLGGLAVRLKSIGGQLEIAFVADKGETARLIDRHSGGLESQLRDAGLGSGGVTISVAAAPGAVAGRTPEPSGFGASGGSGEGPWRERNPEAQRQETPGGNRQEPNDDSSGKAQGAPRIRGDRGFYL
jgi:hypothetical protein